MEKALETIEKLNEVLNQNDNIGVVNVHFLIHDDEDIKQITNQMDGDFFPPGICDYSFSSCEFGKVTAIFSQKI